MSDTRRDQLIDYIEKEFIKFNNKKFGYNKFDYLYIEESERDDGYRCRYPRRRK